MGVWTTGGILLLSIISGMLYMHNKVKAWDNIIYPGIKIEGEDLSGRNKEEAKKIVEQRHGAAVLKKKLNIVTPDRTYTLDYSKINPKHNVDEVVKEAYEYGKNLNLFKQYRLIKSKEGKQYKLGFTYDSKPITELLNNIEKDINKEPVNARLKGYGGSFTAVPEESGRKLQKDKLQKEISSKLNGDKGPDISIEAPIEVITARITSDKLTTINSRIATFTTNYGSISSAERANNIVLSTRSINGLVMLPGDTFSFNEVVGERTAGKGYKAAPVIIGNQVDSGLGGGICQVSTTLYNAILRANIKSVERAHHTLPSHYVPLGLDATVDYGNLDYKFKNTLDYPIYIEGDTSGGNVTFNIYSNSSLTGIVTEVISEVYETIQPGVKYIDDPTLPVGQTQQTQAPSTGFKVKVTKRTKQNGKVISEEVIANDFYKPVDAVIKRGTKK
ncbi:VanW family protein [Clostridium sp. CX1]|uniref:VanW family protein n=1 Tax=Clostridium tanneri TaxID=3037988 RepID=A0ABU4JRZ2_9CLOT|nr:MULTISPECIES: VanW family protein [unclassified Clostridium]MCT8975880.1 VanW family protein [Clostridium sp. CX1]MDW8800736.1 VanW family protein [Clostridium sp. A1-XYC3]